MGKRISAACVGLAMFLSLAWLAFMGFERVATRAEEYIRLEDELNLYGEIGVNREEMVPALNDLAAYIRGETREYNRDVTMFGQVQPLFNQREVAHMVDVAGLFRLERAAKWACLVLALVLAGIGAWQSRDRLAQALQRGAFLCLILILAIVTGFAALYAAIGFEGIFIGFHHVFFHNDLWLMYYDTDAMIRMFPGEFFEILVGRIVASIGLWVGAGALVWAAGYVTAWIREK